MDAVAERAEALRRDREAGRGWEPEAQAVVLREARGAFVEANARAWDAALWSAEREAERARSCEALAELAAGLRDWGWYPMDAEDKERLRVGSGSIWGGRWAPRAWRGSTGGTTRCWRACWSGWRAGWR